MPSTATIPIAVALIALAGVGVSVTLQWINNKRQLRSSHALKMAEMRQAWINELRNAMSAFQSYAVSPHLNAEMTREVYEHGTRIELFMNNEDPQFIELQDCLYRYLFAKTQAEKYAANGPYIAVCQSILKREWEVLKLDLKKAQK